MSWTVQFNKSKTPSQKHNHSAVFQRQVKGTSPCPWEQVKKSWQSPSHCKSFRSCWVAQICALSHQEEEQIHLQKHKRQRPEQAWSETTSWNRHRSIVLKSYGDLRRNGDCPHEGKQVHRSPSSKCGCMLRQDFRFSAFKDKSVYSWLTFTAFLVSVLWCFCFRWKIVSNLLRRKWKSCSTAIRQATAMKHAETFVLKQKYTQLYQWIQSKH